MSKKMNSLGKCIIKDHFKRTRPAFKGGSRHTSDLPDGDGYDCGIPNLRSVTEQSSLEDFLEKVQLSDKEFTSAAYQNVRIITPMVACGMLSEAEKGVVISAQEKHKHMLQIPRRPKWDETTTKEQLLGSENEAFLEWRRNLALLREEEHISLTPYEKNLEVWKQLWRVVERSDIVLQIIDARNPLLFRCEDLEMYVKETDKSKLNVLLLNKSDFLTAVQRKYWADYFSNIGVKVVFFSALQQIQDVESAGSENHECSNETHSEDKHTCEATEHDVANWHENIESVERQHHICKNDALPNSQSTVINSTELLSRDELIEFLKELGRSIKGSSQITAGLVGYPNVGKSSTINAVFLSKKVSVSATPGKTKHFQTLLVDSELCFCDCPGLVFPNFVSTKAEMVINGILPIDQLTNHVPPITLVASLIPRAILQSTYAIMLPLPAEGKDASSPPSAEELLNSHGYMRGFMTQRGLPDNARSARYILKDFVNGKLLYCHAPPGVKQEEYHEFKFATLGSVKPKISGQSIMYAKSCNGKSAQTDWEIFLSRGSKEHTKGMIGIRGYSSSRNSAAKFSENDKSFKKHHNRNRKEKTRRVQDLQEKKRRAEAMFE